LRPICILLLAGLGSACAPAVGSWRADGGAGRISEPRAARLDDRGRDRGRLDEGEEILGCLGQVAVIGGAAAVIYLTRFQGGGGGGGGEVAREAPGAGLPEPDGAGLDSGWGFGPSEGDVSLFLPTDGWAGWHGTDAPSDTGPAGAAPEGGAAGHPGFRPCGRICRPEPAAP
jgi:hypothetical protein